MAKPGRFLGELVNIIRIERGYACSPWRQDEAQRYKAASSNRQTNKIITKSPQKIDSNSLERGATEVDCGPDIAETVAN